MSTQTAYFNLVTRLYTEIKPGMSKSLTGVAGLIKTVGDRSYIAGKALQTALGFATYQVVSTAIMGITSAITGSVQAFVDFELAMANVSRTVQDFDQNAAVMTNFAIDMSTAWGLSIGDVAEAMQFMGSVGMDSYNIMKDFNDIAKMSVALQVDLEDAIQTVVKAQQIWNDEAYTATQVSDILNNMTNKTALNMEFLSGALRMGGPAAAATNTSLEEMTAILVELAETGFKGTMAGRSLNTILVKMGLQSEVLLEHLTKLKGQGFDANLEAMEGFKTASPIEQIRMLAEATEGLTNAQRIQVAQMVGGTNFLKQMLILLNNAEDLERNLATAMNSRGSTQEEVNKITETTAFMIEQVEAETQALAIALGNALQPALLTILELKRDLIEVGLRVLGGMEALVDGTLNFTESIGLLGAAILYAVTGPFGLLAAMLVEVVSAEFAWIDSMKEVEKQQKIAWSLWESGQITGEEYNQMMKDAREGNLQYTESIIKLSKGLDEHEQSLTEVTIGLERNAATTEYARKKSEEYANEILAVNNATEDLNRALAYVSGEMTRAQFETQELTWYTDEAEAAYGYLKGALDEANKALNDTVQALNDVKDATYDNSLATAELRLDMMLLDRALEEGEITEKAYKTEMEALNKEMRDLRITGQILSIENMKLNDTFEDQKEEVDELENQVGVLQDADQKLATAMEGLGEVADLLTEFLIKLDEWLGLTADSADEMGDSLSDSSRLAGTSLETLKTIASMTLWEIQKEFGLTADEAKEFKDDTTTYMEQLKRNIVREALLSTDGINGLIKRINAIPDRKVTITTVYKTVGKGDYDDGDWVPYPVEIVDDVLDGGDGGSTGSNTGDYEWKYSGYATDDNGKQVSVEGGWKSSKTLALQSWNSKKNSLDLGSPSSRSPDKREAAMGYEGWVNQPTMMMVGEKGAEYVSVRNQNQQPGEGGGRGMGSVTINLPNVTSVEDPAQVKRIFRSVMLQLSGER